MIEPNFNKGQHVLINNSIIDKEISMANLSKKDRVIEIGAGTGILTKKISSKALRVLSFEIDDIFENKLNELEKNSSNIKIIIGDALKYNWSSYNKIVSNIPYYLSEAILMKAIRENIEELVLIVGENFKESLLSDNKIGIIGKLFYDVNPIELISKENFIPIPKVNSWLVKLKRKKEFSKKEIIIQNIILRKGKLKNAIIYSFVKEGKTKREVKKLLKEFNIDNNILEKNTNKLTANLIKRINQEIDKLNLEENFE